MIRGSAIIAYLHNLILELWQEEIDNLVLLDGQRVQVNLLHGLDLSILYETTKLGNWLPLLLLVLVGTTTRSSSSASTATVSSTVTSGSKSTSASSSSASWCVSHDYVELIGVERVNSEVGEVVDEKGTFFAPIQLGIVGKSLGAPYLVGVVM